MSIATDQVYTVSRLNGEVRQLLEGQLGRIWLSGEISNFSCPSSGHWYLTLKDSRSQIRCAMFRGRNQNVTFKPINGQQVLVRASISVYEPRGDYQLIIESMLPAGDGLLAQQYEALKMKLAAAGLFAADSKRPLPKNIQRIGVITSPTGAAIRDVLQVLSRRDPAIEVIVYPAAVQGEQAPLQLMRALELANLRQEVDVLLLTRGGGSLEDLWGFNNEALAYAIYNSELPVVSAVGHEVDMTISDFVADVRAPTPSAAAEILSQAASEKQQQLSSARARLMQGWQHWQLLKRQRLQVLDHRLQRQEPLRHLQQLVQRFDEQQLRLVNSLTSFLQRKRQRLLSLEGRFNAQHPRHQLALEGKRLEYLTQQLQKLTQLRLQQAQQRLRNSSHALESVSPLATLSRGYSITRDVNGQIVQSTAQLQPGQQLYTLLKQGKVISKIDKLE
ncbi:exodeoxyribonuclease VII large subunit [Shewanella fodinae]|uniref:exodeoxyribonuclease VII large subunit n=1 Tax=Shewanella fodinae TaxID=552357 RepID=UPI00167673CD|nr:exodeoxyribonuclease VII large subunit [Shewanella fodinae]MCL2907756.1 exodeoxyribonuclease VII large subunit [Shewanella fodinae]GGZ10418.1 exodeoxyribonuclease 7 large subunit [Shewanella fodinae]